MPDAPATGFTDFTAGAVTSGPVVVLKTTSTKYPSDWYVSVGNTFVPLYLYTPFEPSTPFLNACSGGLSTPAAAKYPSCPG
jgi:hypothetical protein